MEKHNTCNSRKVNPTKENISNGPRYKDEQVDMIVRIVFKD